MTFFQNRNASPLEEHDHMSIKEEEQVCGSTPHLINVELPSPNFFPPSTSCDFVPTEIDILQPERHLHSTLSTSARPSAPQPSPWRLRARQETSVVPAKKYGDTLQVYTVAWDEESTLCLIVGMGNGSVARRCDNDMINGTKLLNATGMSRGRRDGILKAETDRLVTKVGPAHLKGVWIPYQRALEIATREGIKRQLYPLFEEDIGSFLYHKNNLMRTQQVVRAAQRRHPVFQAWIYGIPKMNSSREQPGPRIENQEPAENAPGMTFTDNSTPTMNMLPATLYPPTYVPSSPMPAESNTDMEQERHGSPITWNSSSPLGIPRSLASSHHTAEHFPHNPQHRGQELMDDGSPSLRPNWSHEIGTNEEYDQIFTSDEFLSIIKEVDKWW